MSNFKIANTSARSGNLDASFSINRFGETVGSHGGDGSDTSRSAAPRQPSPVVDLKSVGRYRIDSILGKGGFGAVYKGVDDRLDRPVAIKVPLLNGKVDAQEEFLREARQLAKLAHSGIVSVHDVGVDQGRCFIVTEFLEGNNLNEWLQLNRPTWMETVRIVASVADALSHAHALSTVHRDVKPANIIMVNRPEGQQPVLVDFGLAVSDDSSQQRGVISGTPNYMAPEQARGESRLLDGRTDIYAVGVILYRMLCGRLPYRSAKLSELLDKVINDDPQPLRQIVPSLPPVLEQICLKALSKGIDNRHSTAADLAGELRGLFDRIDETAEFPARAVAVPQPVSTETPLGERSSMRRAREAERRYVTMLACDSEFFESEDFVERDPEDQHELLTRFRQTCGDAVAQFGGAIAEFTSQGMLACFGFPVAYEDAAQRAVRCGRFLLEAVAIVGRDKKCEILPRLAVHTGSVVVELSAEPGSAETLSVVGADKNVTWRLGELVEPGSLVISSTTHDLVQSFFECSSQGSHAIRGVSKSIEMFLVTDESAARHRLDLLDPKDLTPLIGRDTELSILRDRWEQATEGMGQVVLLIGDAGLGKSRLIREIREHVAQADPDAALIELRCSSHHQNSGLHPAREFFERLLDFRHGMTPAEKLDALVTHLEDYQLASAEVVPLFAALLSIPLNDRYPALELQPQKAKELTQQALLDWLRQFSSRQPVRRKKLLNIGSRRASKRKVLLRIWKRSVNSNAALN